MGWLQKLQTRWNARNLWQVLLILLAFACTGVTVVLLMKPILFFFFGPEMPTWGKVLYYILILPVYNVILLFYGFLVGQFNFFVEYEKKSFRRMVTLLKKIILF